MWRMSLLSAAAGKEDQSAGLLSIAYLDLLKCFVRLGQRMFPGSFAE